MRIGARVRSLVPRRAFTAIVALLLLALGFGVWRLSAQPAPPETRPTRVGVGIVQRKLTLRECVETALRNNLEIEIERANRAGAGQAVNAARGAFDPTFRWQPSFDLRNSPVASVLQGSGKLTERQSGQNFYFRQPWARHGTLLHADFENGWQSTNNPFVGFNPYINSRLVLGFTQPLWRNRVIDRDRAEIRIRSKSLEVSENELELRVIDVVSRVEQTYWDLVAARQDVEVKADGVRWAREQLARNQRMIDSGTLPPVELAASEAELERRLDTWYQSLGLVTEIENALKALLSQGRDAAIWNDEIVPTESRPVEPPSVVEVRDAVATALKQRPELQQVEVRKQSNQIQKELAADQRKPSLNLVGGYVNSGLGGSARADENPFAASQVALYERLNRLSAMNGLPPIPPASFGSLPDNLIGGYGTALRNVFGASFQSAQVGLQFDLNLRNRAAEANLAQAQIAERRLALERTRLEQAIEAQVRNALQAIQTARQRITAAEASARAAKEKLDSEIRLFQTGESTNFLVLTRQNEYLDSRRRAVVATLDFNKAVARLGQALGSTLQTHGITVK